MTRPAALTIPAARDWRDRAARAAAADVGRASEAEAVAQARRMADRGRLGAVAGLAALAALGAIAGWTTTAELLRPAEGPVHAALALLAIAGGPWLLLALRSLVLLAFRRRVSPVLGRIVTTGLLRAAGRDAGARDLSAATARRIGGMLAAGSGRCLAAAGSGTFWTAYAAVAVATIWIVTARVALGFGWESSWIPPSFGRAVVELAAAPLTPLIGGDELAPIAAAPAAPADDPAALAARRAWIRFLTAGVAAYLLLPMAVWTLLQAVLGHRRAVRWRPTVAVVTRSTAAAALPPTGPVAAAPPRRPPGGGPCTHVVRLERPARAVGLPAPLDRLDDLGNVDAAADLERVRGVVHAGPARVAIVGWLPATPDRAVRRRLRTLADASHEPPLLVLDGGDVLRRGEPARTAAARLEDWRALARATGVAPLECDLAELTDASRRRLAGAIGPQTATNGGGPAAGSGFGAGPPPTGGGLPPAGLAGSGPGARSAPPRAGLASVGLAGSRPGADPAPLGGGPASVGLDPAPLDAAFGAIGRHLEGDDPLPADTALASCLDEVARTFRAEAGGDPRTEAWSARLAALRGLDASDASSLAASLAATGVGLLPAALRQRALWAGLGGLLGAAACAAAASVAPAALLALPSWAAAGAGVAGLLSLVRRGGTPGAPPAADAAPDRPRRLGEAVFAAAASAVLWWAQGADEARTTRALEALAPDDVAPALDDADGARRWLAAARGRVVAAAGGDA